MAWLSEIQAYLIAEGVGTAASIFRDNMPDRPVNAMALSGYSGRPIQYDTDGDALGFRQLQIAVRNTSSDAAWAWVEAARVALMKVKNSTLSGGVYLFARPTSSAMSLGWDASGAFNLTQNFEVCRSE